MLVLKSNISIKTASQDRIRINYRPSLETHLQYSRYLKTGGFRTW